MQKIIFKVPFLIAFSVLFLNACKPDSQPKSTQSAEKSEPNLAAFGKVKPQKKKAVTLLNQQKPLTLIIKNLASKSAPVLVTFYQKKHKFLSLTDILKTYTLTPNGDVLTSQIDDLNYGEYAIASYQDVNSDNKIDKNLIGIPKEPYGFSNNYKPTVRAPHYSECKFAYNKNKHAITITMIQ